jgi:hypothetical protein
LLVNSGPGGGFFRRGNIRTSIPTGQISLQSTYIPHVDLTGSVTYSGATSD